MKNTNTIALALTVLVSGVILTGCERPPIDTEQVGYRGTAMVLVDNPRAEKAEIVIPTPQAPAAPGGPKAGDIYQNVQVLGDLSIGEFTRTMLAITEWVSPEEGCNYCHNPQNLASDDKYTKVVSRRMVQMTQHLNENWGVHTGEVGVTCYTCHNGKNVPENIWFASDDIEVRAAYAGNKNGQNVPTETNGYTDLTVDPFSYFLIGDSLDKISVNTDGWQPTGETGTIVDAEHTYSLMFHMSEGLGVNCNFCHNSRNFAAWDQSRPQRVTAWHGLRMVTGLNNDYLVPLGPTYPENRLGPLGDAPKVNCATCHQGINKPLGGVNMVKDYPALQGE